MKLGGNTISKNLLKKYPTLGCCGLDCGLCPRYYTEGPSRCPGCCGPDFFNKHPSCGFITCCVKKKELEVCVQCDEFPCQKIEKELNAGLKSDSFITHRKAKPNMDFIKNQGLEKYLEEQKRRITFLEMMLGNYDSGRSKSYYCLASTILPLADIENSLNEAEEKIKKDKIQPNNKKEKEKILKGFLNAAALEHDIEFKLRKKK